MQYGNYGTGYIGLYLSDSAYDKILNDDKFTQVREYLIKTDENADIASVKKSVSKLFKDKNIPTLALMVALPQKQQNYGFKFNCAVPDGICIYCMLVSIFPQPF